MREGQTRPVLRRLVTLEERAQVADSGGGWLVTWQPVGALWADLLPVAGTELTEGARERSRVTHRVIVRAAPDGAPSRPRPDQRFREGVRNYDILAVTEHDPQGRYLVCWTEEGRSS